jgi:hypothetical protein
MRTDGRTDGHVMKLAVAFCNLANTPKKEDTRPATRIVEVTMSNLSSVRKHTLEHNRNFVLTKKQILARSKIIGTSSNPTPR